MANKNSQKEIYLTVNINEKEIFTIEVKGSPELMGKMIEEFNSSYGVIYELKEQLRKYVEKVFPAPKKK